MNIKKIEYTSLCTNSIENTESTTEKNILIKGTNNRYMMKKLINSNEKKIKKRVESEKWTFSNEYFEYENQMKIINDISINEYKYKDEITKIASQQIHKKINSYKHQDILKNRLNNEKLITFISIVNKMIECQLKCRYCNDSMNVLYDISREMKQWSVDRIDNELGHNIDNFHLACLECNLKRRRRTDEKFLFTKQLNIIKK